MTALARFFGLPTKTRAPRAKEWHVHMRHPVTGATLWTAICDTKRDALAEAAWNIRPDRAPSEPQPQR